EVEMNPGDLCGQRSLNDFPNGMVHVAWHCGLLRDALLSPLPVRCGAPVQGKSVEVRGQSESDLCAWVWHPTSYGPSEDSFQSMVPSRTVATSGSWYKPGEHAVKQFADWRGHCCGRAFGVKTSCEASYVERHQFLSVTSSRGGSDSGRRGRVRACVVFV